MTFSLLPRSKAGLAGGLVMGSAGFGNAFGPLLGGALKDTVGWRWVFFLNLPIALAAIGGSLVTLYKPGPAPQPPVQAGPAEAGAAPVAKS